MFTRLTLKMQLTLSIVSILLLLVIVFSLSYNGLNSGFSNFKEYRSLARNTNLAGRIQANMLMVRLNVLKYIKKDSSDILASYQERSEKLDQFLALAAEDIQNPIRTQDVKESTRLLKDYTKAFDKAKDLIAQRHHIVNNELNPSGLAMRKEISELIRLAHDSGETEVLYNAAITQETLLLGRLYVVKFLVSNINADYNRALVELKDNIRKPLNNLDNDITDSSQKELMEQFHKHYTTYLRAFEQTHEIISARNELTRNKLDVIGPVIAEKIENVKLSIKADQDKLGPKAQSESEVAVVWVLWISIASLVVGGLLSWYLPRMIQAPIGGEPAHIATITRRIADGDLTHVFVDSENATGIYGSISEMSTRLQSIIGSIVKTGTEIDQAADNLATVSKETNKVVIEQKDKTAMVATAVTEMSSNIQEMVQNAVASSEAAKEAKEESEKGKAIVATTINSIEALAGKVDNSVDVIKTLAENSNNIVSVVEVIQNICEQTNLLALNAAIEAARAGELGRGFAVVADEVRSLAQRTDKSTSEIQEMINTLQTGTTEAVQVMEESRKEAHATVGKSVETGEALDAILVRIDSINDMNSQLAASMEEQSVVIEDINKNVILIADSSDISANASRESTESSEEMKHLSGQLEVCVSGFKLPKVG